MITNTHFIELYINGKGIELESQDSLNLRMNNVLFDPTKASTTQAEYSFSFDIPSTPNNDKILNYASSLAKANKFHNRYPTQVYSDGTLIFDGSLTVEKFDYKDKVYSCNLVNIKINSLDEIFGDMTLADLKWNVDFDGAPTINSVNSDLTTKYFFPLVSYGVFQKNAESTDEVGSEYTSKFDIDKYTNFWVESFYPSLNVTETIRKAFENVKDENGNQIYSIGGSVFSDPNISNVYASCNLADEQVPTYNLGNPKFGSLDLSVDFSNTASINSQAAVTRSGTIDRTSGSRVSGFGRNSSGGLTQDLSFPYEYVKPAINAEDGWNTDAEYNFSTIQWWNMLDSKTNTGVTVTVNNPSYMYDPNEMVIVIPSDGWYRIDLSVTADLANVDSTFNAPLWYTSYYQGDKFEQKDCSIRVGWDGDCMTPLEIQLIRNYEDNIELIKGKKNVIWATGDPNQETYTYRGGSYTGSTSTNRLEWLTEFPHQELAGSRSPTKTDEIVVQSSRNVRNASSFGASTSHVGTTRGGNLGGRRGDTYNTDDETLASVNAYGYMTSESGGPNVMPFDPAVSTAFICGVSTMSNGQLSTMKNGRSWSKVSSTVNEIFAPIKGLDLYAKESDGSTSIMPTNHDSCKYVNATTSLSLTKNKLISRHGCCVRLNRNDALELVAVQRYYDAQKYGVTAHVDLKITAMSEKTQAELKAMPSWTFYSDTQFPTQLNLFNFTNKETKVSEWINNVVKAFNLEVVQDGYNIDFNINRGIKKSISYAVDIDDRVSSDEAEAQYISYPREMSVKYKIDTDEWGFERTVSDTKINLENWKDYGDSGFTVISLSDDTYEVSTQNVQTNFSYTYYDAFDWKEVDRSRTETGVDRWIQIPVIEKSEFMADGYGYDEAMKHDGYSFTQRFWFRQAPSTEYVYLNDHLQEQVFFTYPINSYDGFNLSYKDTEKSIMSEYFNVSPMLSSNYVNIDVYLTPKEYMELKGGALIHYDSDLYYVSEISGYDPSGQNTTSLKLIKKI